MATSWLYPIWVMDAIALMETDALKAFMATALGSQNVHLKKAGIPVFLKEGEVTLEWESEDRSQRFESWLCHSLAIGPGVS